MRSEEEIQSWLIDAIAEAVGVEPEDIDVQEPFATYGLNSVNALTLSGDLETWLGRRLSPLLAWDYPTVESLSRHLVSILSVEPAQR